MTHVKTLLIGSSVYFSSFPSPVSLPGSLQPNLLFLQCPEVLMPLVSRETTKSNQKEKKKISSLLLEIKICLILLYFLDSVTVSAICIVCFFLVNVATETASFMQCVKT